MGNFKKKAPYCSTSRWCGNEHLLVYFQANRRIRSIHYLGMAKTEWAHHKVGVCFLPSCI